MQRGIWVEVKCTSCGVSFEKRQSDAKRVKSGRHFCSAACLRKVGAKPRTGISKPCEQCATEMYVSPSTPGKRFCSNDCKNAWQRRNQQTQTCAVCGTTYDLSPSQKYYRSEYCSRACWSLARIQRPLDRMHNGKPAALDNQGYVRIFEPGHPRAFGGWVFEHRWIVEQALGRYLDPDEHVHHINHVRSDNRPENLQHMSNCQHAAITARENGEAMRSAIQARDALASRDALIAKYEAKFGPLE